MQTCADDTIAKATLKVPRIEILQAKLKTDRWLSKALSLNIDQACSLINTGDVYQIATDFAADFASDESKMFSNKSKLYINYCEIAIVLHIVDLLVECGVAGQTIGVIASYRGQVEALKKILSHHSTVEVNTVDQYQGRDKNVIIYSCTQSKTNQETPKSSDVEILDDRRRLTVAITRAKHKLIIIGDGSCLNNYTPFRDLFKHMSSLSKFQLEDGKSGFSWKNVLNSLREKL